MMETNNKATGALRISLKKGAPPVDTKRKATAGPQAKAHLFLGDPESPLLAPRGVCLTKDKLLVADTGQNRVFIWEDYQAILEQGIKQQKSALVLGQHDRASTGRNAGDMLSASSLQYPSGIWSDGQKIILADAWNHRVLVWHEWPKQMGQAADVVIGQVDFSGNQPNEKGVGTNPNAHRLYWPYGLWSDGERLWIADTGNRRVLYYENIPTENFATADAVIGKSSFVERDYEAEDAIWPYSIKIGPNGELAITDTQYYRVLIWSHWKNALEGKAEIIIGQEDFASNGMNQYGLYPEANTLNWTYDSCFYKKGILVADTGNSRVLCFDKIPSRNNASANDLIGQPDFNTGSENSATILGTEDAMYWPFALSVMGDHLAIAETGNHRIRLQKMLR